MAKVTRPKAAVIGLGFIGPVHAEALSRIGVEVVGLLGSTPSRAQRVADRLGVGRVYRDLADLLADPAVEVVHVASPNANHDEQVRGVLGSGRHVVCEKPLATTVAQSAGLRDLAASHPNLAAAVNYNVRFYPLCHEMRARVARGDIGRLLSVTGSYTQDWLLKPTDYNWRVEADGGTNLRAVADIGTHWMDLAQFVAGVPITRVLADLATFHPERLRPAGASETFQMGGGEGSGTIPVAVTTEDYAAVLLRFEGGAHGVFHVSQAVAGRKNRLAIEVSGTSGSLAWQSESPDRLRAGRRDVPSVVLERDPALLSPEAARLANYPGGHAEGFPDTFKQLFLAVYDHIAGGCQGIPPFPTFEDGDRELRLCEAIAQSQRAATWREVQVG